MENEFPPKVAGTHMSVLKALCVYYVVRIHGDVPKIVSVRIKKKLTVSIHRDHVNLKTCASNASQMWYVHVLVAIVNQCSKCTLS